jgi:transposase
MGYIKYLDRKDTFLFPERLDDYVSLENVVRLMDAFIDSLSLGELGFIRAVPAMDGRPGYDPKDLLKLYVYGYFYRIRSSRRLEKEVQRNIELIWMLGKIKPDFRTISDFRKDNRKSLKKVFKEFNSYCDNLGLYSKEYISIDGSKFRAVNSKDNNFTQSKLDDRLKRLDSQIEDYLTLLDSNDTDDSGKNDERKFTAKELNDKIAALKERKEKYECIQNQLEASGTSQISLTDHESKLMKANNGGFDVSFNVQTAIDAGSHMIAGFEVTDHPSDHGLLKQVSQTVKDDFALKTIEATADKGYQDKTDMMNCLESGIIPNVIPPRGKDGFDLETVYEEKEISDEQKASVEENDLKETLRAGIIPDIYKDVITSIEVSEKTISIKENVQGEQRKLTDDEMKEEAATGKFVRNIEKNFVYCPCGQILRQKSEKGNGTIRYWNKLACTNCKNKCTESKFKTVDFSTGAIDIVCNKWEPKNSEQGVVACTSSAETDKETSNEDKKKCITKKETVKVVRLHLKVDQVKCANRKCLSEHPFGTIKRTLDSSYLLLKGKEKVTGELSLSFLAYNIKRAVNMLGVRKLMEAFAN